MSAFAPEIFQNLEVMAIEAYLIKHKLLCSEECYQEYYRPFHSGTSNEDLVRKLLPKIDKNPRCFYDALCAAVNDSQQDQHPGHSILLEKLSVPVDVVYTYICTCNYTDVLIATSFIAY